GGGGGGGGGGGEGGGGGGGGGGGSGRGVCGGAHRPPLALRADQALCDHPPRLLHRRGGGHADAEAQAPRLRAALRSRDRAALRGLERTVSAESASRKRIALSAVERVKRTGLSAAC